MSIMNRAVAPDVGVSGRRPSEGRRIWYRGRWMLTVLSIAIGLGIWQLSGMAFPTLVPNLGTMATTLISSVGDGVLLSAAGTSLMAIIVSFAVALTAATILGFILGWYATPRALVDPWVQFFRMIPPIALLPLVVVYLGVGTLAKDFIIFFSGFLIMLITIFQGVRQIDVALVRAARVLGCGDLKLFVHVVLPASVPHILTAARIGISASWTALVAAELISSSNGLGFLIEQGSQFFEMGQVYLGIVAIGILGLLMDRIVLILQKRLTAWQDVAAK